MAVTKRTRYEVLKRDNHTCRYCGAAAPDAKLHVDHVTPVALGGTDTPDNLVAACKDCNAGKGSTSPTEAMVQQVGEDDIRWAQAIKKAAAQMLAETEAQSDRHEWFLSEWRSWDKDCTYLPNGWAVSVDSWTGAGLPNGVLISCLEIAIGNRSVQHDGVFAYMGGVARNKIAKLHEDAKALIDEVRPNGS